MASVPLRFVLIETSHPGNIGAVARAMKNMALEDLVLVNPLRFPDPEATARASGADDVLARARVVGSLAEAIDGCGLVFATTARERDSYYRVVDARTAARRIVAEAGSTDGGSRPAAVLFGTERTGLTNEQLGNAQALLRIPANPAYASLNLAAAVQVACYELATAASAFTPPAEPERTPATVEEIEAFHAHLERAMIASGFLDPAMPKRLMERMRRLFARAGLEREEVQFLRGMLAAFEKQRAKG